MTVKTLIYFATALFCFECGITVYRFNRRALANRLYAGGAFLYAFFSLAYVQILVSPDAATSRAWFMLYSPFFFLVVMLIVHFIMELTRYRNLARSPYFLALLYGSGAFVIAGVIGFAPVVKGFYKSPWGWIVLYDFASSWTWVALNYSSLVLLPCIVALVSWRKNASSERAKMQAGMILLATLATMLLTLGQNALTLLLTAETSMLVGDAYHQVVSIFFICSIRFAIWKYKILAVDPSSTASELFSGISDAVFLVDRKGDVVFMNDRARDLILQSSAVSGPLSLAALFPESANFQKAYRKIRSGASPVQPLTLVLTRRGRARMLELFMYPLRNESGRIAGVLIIGQEQTGLYDLQRHVGLTDRELELLCLIGSGLSAGEIADECGIALQTAKSHIHNIYLKTGLKNRVELTNFLNKHS